MKFFKVGLARQIGGGAGHEIDVAGHHFRQFMALVFGPSVAESLGQFADGFLVGPCLALGRWDHHHK
jgi:hypothetical protein